MEEDKILNDFIEVMNYSGFDISNITMNEELDYDSLQFVSTMVSFELKFGIEIPDDYLLAEGLNTAQDIFCLIKKLVLCRQ